SESSRATSSPPATSSWILPEALMQIGVPVETYPGETRVAATPETVRKYVKAGHSVVVQSGAGLAASCTDQAYVEAGAQLGTAQEAFAAELILKVRAPFETELSFISPGQVVLGMLDPYNGERLQRLAE